MARIHPSSSRRRPQGRRLISDVQRARVHRIFGSLGLTPAEAMALFYAHVEKYQAWPFERKLSPDMLASLNEDVSRAPTYRTLEELKQALKS